MSTIKDHLKSKEYCQKKAKISRNDSERPAKRQKTLAVFQYSSELREDLVKDFTRACLDANICKHQAAQLRPFLRKHCANGGEVIDATNKKGRPVPKVEIDKRQEVNRRVQKDGMCH